MRWLISAARAETDELSRPGMVAWYDLSSNLDRGWAGDNNGGRCGRAECHTLWRGKLYSAGGPTNEDAAQLSRRRAGLPYLPLQN
jgi:hypothetical protein